MLLYKIFRTQKDFVLKYYKNKFGKIIVKIQPKKNFWPGVLGNFRTISFDNTDSQREKNPY